MLIKILILVILILINGIFSATEIAFLSINKYKLNKEIKNENKKAKKIAKLLSDEKCIDKYVINVYNEDTNKEKVTCDTVV